MIKLSDCFCVNNYRYKCKYKENIQNISDGRKQILSPFTGREKRKAWNKTKEKYVTVQQTGDHITKRNGQENL